MAKSAAHRKTVRHYHEPGQAHELTFSCYHRMPLLTNDAWRSLLSQSINRAMNSHRASLLAFVYMPEHVHLLVLPTTNTAAIDKLLFAIKRPFSFRIKRYLEQCHASLLDRLTIRERPGKESFRFWQEGPGYDRNIYSDQAVRATIEYIHENPVRRRLVSSAAQWRWSSWSVYYQPVEAVQLEGLPTITKFDG